MAPPAPTVSVQDCCATTDSAASKSAPTASKKQEFLLVPQESHLEKLTALPPPSIREVPEERLTLTGPATLKSKWELKQQSDSATGVESLSRLDSFSEPCPWDQRRDSLGVPLTTTATATATTKTLLVPIETVPQLCWQDVQTVQENPDVPVTVKQALLALWNAQSAPTTAALAQQRFQTKQNQ